MNQEYKENGYFLIKNLFDTDELKELAAVAYEFHELWKRKNAKFYAEKAVNSAYITGTEYLDEEKRNALFRFIGSARFMRVVYSVIPDRPAFMNTQLFFDPVNENQKNYWHRDPQYHLSIKEQQAALDGPDVIHCRIPLVNEPGIELVPGSHKRWDTAEEMDVRLENNGHKNYEDLSTGLHIHLEAGDLLVFSANMIHRGLYGMNRLSLDVLFCDSDKTLMTFVDADCLPGLEILKNIEDPSAFANTLNLKIKSP